ncbi:MAG: serine hydrolase [Gammaproteobacteria bacterium]|nr:serine hydrolase [Gammaproteobacteria bacterium]
MPAWGAPRQAGESHGLQLRSGAALVLDAATADVLVARNAATPGSIASITKLMTALVVLEAGQPLDETLTIGKDDALGARGTPSQLAPGTRLTRADLLHLALMASENRAAQALARHYPGGVAACVAAMNRKAKALGMPRARFVDPTGLGAGNVATPQELVRLVEAAADNATIRAYSTDPQHEVRVGRQQLEYRNTDTLVRDPDWDVIVQKTGFTHAAGRCLVMKARVDGRELVIVLLDSFGKHTRVADARRIRKWLGAQALLGGVLASARP